MAERKEKDSIGEIAVPEDRLWGAQTQRSLENFAISQEKIPIEVIHALALVKEAAAFVNGSCGNLSEEKSLLIQEAASQIRKGIYDDHFPLKVWQTGSGTQSNMNVNEVIANIVAQKKGKPLGSKDPVHPNDDVNRAQSSNDIFPTAMHIAAKLKIEKELLPALEQFEKSLEQKEKEFAQIVKIGRTHLMDAVPLTLGAEFGGFKEQVIKARKMIIASLDYLSELPIGGTAVGTGLNSPKGFDESVVSRVSQLCGSSFKVAPSKFAMIASEDASVAASSALKLLAVALAKIAGDIRMLGSGPRCGIGELLLPANEPGSSIMPGKVNPTQCEAMAQIAVHVMGSDSAISFGGSLGQFELNTYRPMMIYNLLQSVTLLTDGMVSFNERCLTGIKANHKNIQAHLNNSLMLATALNPVIGYDQVAKVVKKAYEEDKTLKQAALELGALTPEAFDEHMDPKNMLGHK